MKVQKKDAGGNLPRVAVDLETVCCDIMASNLRDVPTLRMLAEVVAARPHEAGPMDRLRLAYMDAFEGSAPTVARTMRAVKMMRGVTDNVVDLAKWRATRTA